MDNAHAIKHGGGTRVIPLFVYMAVLHPIMNVGVNTAIHYIKDTVINHVIMVISLKRWDGVCVIRDGHTLIF